jgi:hypothetical protein
MFLTFNNDSFVSFVVVVRCSIPTFISGGFYFVVLISDLIHPPAALLLHFLQGLLVVQVPVLLGCVGVLCAPVLCLLRSSSHVG